MGEGRVAKVVTSPWFLCLLYPFPTGSRQRAIYSIHVRVHAKSPVRLDPRQCTCDTPDKGNATPHQRRLSAPNPCLPWKSLQDSGSIGAEADVFRRVANNHPYLILLSQSWFSPPRVRAVPLVLEKGKVEQDMDELEDDLRYDELERFSQQCTVLQRRICRVPCQYGSFLNPLPYA